MLAVLSVALSSFAWLAANVGFIHFHDAREQAAVIGLGHGLADLHAAPPRGVLVHFQVTGELKGGQPFLGVQDQHDRQEPLLKGHMGTVKNGADCHAEAGFAVVAAVPVLALGGIEGATIGATNRAAPAGFFEVGDTAFLGGKRLENLYNVHGFLSWTWVSISYKTETTKSGAGSQDLKLGNSDKN